MSVAGTQFHFVALPWVVLDATGSGLALGGVLTAAAIPRAVFMLAGGAMTDRFSPRGLMLVSNITRALLAAVLALSIAADRTPLLLLYVVSALFGVADALFYPAYTALVPRLVPGAALAAANSLIQGTAHTAGLAVPAAAGLLIAAAGSAAAFGIDAASFVFAAAILASIRGGGAAPAPAAGTVFAAIAAGLAYVRSERYLRTLLVAIAILNLAFVGPFVVGGTALARERFAGGPAALGWLFSALAAGALAGTALAAPIDRRGFRPGALVAAGMVVIASALALLSLVAHVPQACAAVALAGLAAGSLNPLILSWLQRQTPTPLHGRVMSLAMLGGVGLTPVSFLLAGILVAHGTSTLFLAASVVMLLGAAAIARALRTSAVA